MLDDSTRLKTANFMAKILIFKQLGCDDFFPDSDSFIEYLEFAKKKLADTSFMVAPAAEKIGVSLDDFVAYNVELIDKLIDNAMKDESILWREYRRYFFIPHLLFYLFKRCSAGFKYKQKVRN